MNFIGPVEFLSDHIESDWFFDYFMIFHVLKKKLKYTWKNTITDRQVDKMENSKKFFLEKNYKRQKSNNSGNGI